MIPQLAKIIVYYYCFFPQSHDMCVYKKRILIPEQTFARRFFMRRMKTIN